MSLKRIAMLTAVSLSLAGGQLFAAKVVDKTLAVVNGEAIMKSEFDKVVQPVVEQYKAAAPESEQTDAKLAELKKRLLDQMVDDKLLKQEAVAQKIRVTKRELEEGVSQVKKRFPSEAEFNAELKKEGMTAEQFRQRIEEQIMVMKLIENEIKAKATPPTEEETRAFFEKIQKKMNGKDLDLADKKEEQEIAALAQYLDKLTDEQVRASHILVKVGKDASREEKAAALDKVKQIQKELKGGADFGDLARKYSDDPGSAARGGDLGYFTKGDMVPAFSKTAFELRVGEVSQPVLTEYGYHLIKVSEHRDRRKVTYDDVKKDLGELLMQKSAQKRYEQWMKELRAKANLQINPID